MQWMSGSEHAPILHFFAAHAGTVIASHQRPVLCFETCAPVSDDEHCLAHRYVLRTFGHQNGSNISVFLRLPAYSSLVCLNIADEVAGRDLLSRWARERQFAFCRTANVGPCPRSRLLPH